MSDLPVAKILSAGTPSPTFAGFGGISQYVERFSAAVALKRSPLFDPSRDAATQMDALFREARTASPNPAYHYVLSWMRQDVAHDEVWSTVDRSLRTLGLHDHQWLAAIHGDTQHTHAHVLVNRIDPHSKRYWRGRGTDRRVLSESVGWTKAPATLDRVKPRARDLEYQTGQISFQRWLRENVSPAAEEELGARAGTWASLELRLGREFGLALERTRDGLSVVDRNPDARRKKPLAMHVSALRVSQDLDALECAWSSGHARPNVRVDFTKGYAAAFAAYRLPTDRLRHPIMAPLYERFVATRTAWYAAGVLEWRRQRELVRAERDRQLATVRRAFRDLVARRLAGKDALTRDFVRALMVPLVYKPWLKAQTDAIREAARARLAALRLRFPIHLFRPWLNAQAAAGDRAALRARDWLRTGLARAPDIDARERSGDLAVVPAQGDGVRGMQSAGDGGLFESVTGGRVRKKRAVTDEFGTGDAAHDVRENVPAGAITPDLGIGRSGESTETATEIAPPEDANLGRPDQRRPASSIPSLPASHEVIGVAREPARTAEPDRATQVGERDRSGGPDRTGRR